MSSDEIVLNVEPFFTEMRWLIHGACSGCARPILPPRTAIDKRRFSIPYFVGITDG